MELIGAFESTYLPAHDVDVLETSGHVARWREDLELLRAHGVTRLRYPVRWHRVASVPGRLDWRHTDAVLGHLRTEGFEPILDLVHHTSYPRWLTGGFADPRFPAAFVDWCEAVALRYPWVREHTLFNEPFATLFLAGHEAIWPPHLHGMEGFVALLRNVLPAVAEASRRLAELLPGASHVWTDSCEGHTATDPAGEAYAALANDRRFFALDALLGRAGDRSRPFVAEVVAAGGADLLELEPGRIDVLGLDYYAHHEWSYGCRTAGLPPEVALRRRHPHGPGHPQCAEVEGRQPGPNPQGLARLVLQYAEHSGLPLVLTETNLLGATSDRATFLKHTLEQCEEAIAAGAPLQGFCWFGFLDSLDWNSLLERADRSIDPVGVLSLDERLERHESSMSRAYAAAARGARSSELPAFRFTAEAEHRVAGLLPLMAHFDWQEPPPEEVERHDRGRLTARIPEEDPPMTPRDELVVFSHLPWTFVWQRPQHLVSRIGRDATVWFVEEPKVAPVAEPRLCVEERDGVRRVWLEVPGEARMAGFDDPEAKGYGEALAALLGPSSRRTIWLYTPLALPLAERLEQRMLVLDVMDDLSAFAHASPALRLMQQRALREADLVFAGGRSIHAALEGRCDPPAHLFPSGVEPEHYAPARALRGPRERPVAGYVGVVDERLDLELVAGLAERLPGWDVELVGPVFKIDEADLPRAANLRYPGMQPYDRLPQVMAGFDVALMPFARNDATRSISPTKTLEYLAAGLPVVSTRVADVVADYKGIVDLHDDAAGFAAACEALRAGIPADREARVAAILEASRWDAIAERMSALVRARLAALQPAGRQATSWVAASSA